MIIDLTDIEFLEEYNKRTVFDNEQSSLTLISFKKGCERALHVDEKDEVVQIIEGEAKVVIGGEKYVLKDKQMIVLPSKNVHGFIALKDTKILLLRPKHIHNKD